MKVAVYYSASDIRVEERPKPRIGDGEILVKMKACGICGSDLMEWYRIKKAPRVLGHEMVGVVAESKSSRFKEGDVVFASHHVPCNNCKYCNEGDHTACETLHRGNFDPGGFSEYVRVPKINVDFGTYVLPENVSIEEGTMIEPLACCVRGQRVIGVKPGHVVLIPGAGVSGLMNIQLAKLRGAYVVSTDVNAYRLEKAKEFGADEVLNAEEELDVKADRIIMCTGAKSAFEKMWGCLDRKGRILTFAIPNEDIVVPSENFWRNEYAMASSYGAAPSDLEESLRLISSGKVKVKGMITDRFPLEKILEGWKLAGKGGKTLKVLITGE
ncbi:MAG: alcohol dehydrogenase catalytic domain-containing protein [Candidatus Brockarchaeota archaeon]|nr:alcohol dehydrogenase catalytic domain-containing protein [Candidatus Brockarchaeota archaeon]